MFGLSVALLVLRGLELRSKPLSWRCGCGSREGACDWATAISGIASGPAFWPACCFAPPHADCPRASFPAGPLAQSLLAWIEHATEVADSAEIDPLAEDQR